MQQDFAERLHRTDGRQPDAAAASQGTGDGTCFVRRLRRHRRPAGAQPGLRAPVPAEPGAAGWLSPPSRSIPRAPRKPSPGTAGSNRPFPQLPRDANRMHLQDQQPVALVAIVPIGFPGLDLQALGAGALPAVQGF